MTAVTVTVRVPATSANLGPGFDSFGVALARYDEVTATLRVEGLLVEVQGVGADEVPLTHEHLVVRAVARAFASVGEPLPGLHLKCVNCIPHGGGLGSSASAIVAGLLLGRELIVHTGGRRLSDDEVLGLATEMEGHPDNVAPALFGGFTLAFLDDQGPARRGAPGGAPGCASGRLQRASGQFDAPHPRIAAGDGAARRRQRERGRGGPAGACADHRPCLPAAGHPRPAAPGLPGAGHAGVRSDWSVTCGARESPR